MTWKLIWLTDDFWIAYNRLSDVVVEIGEMLNEKYPIIKDVLKQQIFGYLWFNREITLKIDKRIGEIYESKKE